MPTLLSEKTVKARKPHACRCCETVCIQPGDSYTRSTYVYDGRVYDWVICTGCAAITTDVWDWADGPEEGISAEDYQEWAQDMLASPHGGERDAAQAFLDRRAKASEVAR
jgi:hypothetical protein